MPQKNQVPQNSNSAYQLPGVSVADKAKKLWPFILATVLILGAIIYGIVWLVNREEAPVNGGIAGSIKFWGTTVDEQTMNEIIAEFEETYPSVTVQYEKKAVDEYAETVKTRLEGGNPNLTPDVFEIDSNVIPTLMENLAYTETVSATEVESTYFPGAKPMCRQAGYTFCLPMSFDGLVLVYNEEAIKSAGFEEVPSDWDDFYLFAEQLGRTIGDPEERDELTVVSPGAAIGTGRNVTYGAELAWLMMIQNGVAIDESGNLDAVAKAKGEAAAELYASYYQGGIWDTQFGVDLDAFANRRVPVVFVDLDGLKYILEQNPEFTVRTTAPPQITGQVNFANFDALAVSATSPSQAAAWEFAKYLTTADVQRKMLSSNETPTKTKISARRDLLHELADYPELQGFVEIYMSARPVFIPEYATAKTYMSEALDSIAEDPRDADTYLERFVSKVE